MKTASDSKNSLTIPVIYATFAILLGALINYIAPYDPEPITAPPPLSFILAWALLYIPLIVFSKIPGWETKKFGFTVNVRIWPTMLFIIPACFPIGMGFQIPWQSALIEAIARTGEEIFLRGFLFLLILKIFEGRARAWLWAIFLSTLVFALVHTQTFQSSYFSDQGSTPTVYLIIQRLFNIFLLGILFGVLRHWTQSLLPGVMIHTLLQGGLLAMVFGLVIYFLITLLAIAGGKGARPVVALLK